jgi:hypothetical protein
MRRPLVDTYLKVKTFLETQENLSIRKQFCLQFLKWCYTAKKEDRDEFVELSKEFRKLEQKVGSTRTFLERKARRLYWKIAKHKKLEPSRKGAKEWCEKSQEKQIGIFSPEYKANLSEKNRIIRMTAWENDRGPHIMDWILTSPTGETFKIRNLSRWCRENNFDSGNMSKTSIYPGRTCKGWKAQKYSPDMDPFL